MSTVTEEKSVVAAGEKQELSVEDLQGQAAKVQAALKAVMKKGEHYGTIGGVNKPFLFKAGAEKLGFMFRLAPSFEIQKQDHEHGHREYSVVCTLTHIPTGDLVAQGVGSCSTLEGKYRYRNVYENGSKNRIENPNIADTYNTILKMAKKRAHVDAMITACAASDIFSQDEETAATTSDTKPKQQKPKRSNAELVTKCESGVAFLLEHGKFTESQAEATRATIQTNKNNRASLLNMLENMKELAIEVEQEEAIIAANAEGEDEPSDDELDIF